MDLAQYPVYLEISVDNDTPLSPRQKLTSTPYAQIAGEAESVVGGQVNASEIQVNGTLVVNTDGSWVGPTINVNWGDIQNVPAGFADQIDNQLNENEVEDGMDKDEVEVDDDKLAENDVSSEIGKADNKVADAANDSSKVGQGPESEGSDKKAGDELGVWI